MGGGRAGRQAGRRVLAAPCGRRQGGAPAQQTAALGPPPLTLPSSTSPRRMSSNSRSDSSTGRSRQGLGSRASRDLSISSLVCNGGVGAGATSQPRARSCAAVAGDTADAQHTHSPALLLCWGAVPPRVARPCRSKFRPTHPPPQAPPHASAGPAPGAARAPELDDEVELRALGSTARATRPPGTHLVAHVGVPGHDEAAKPHALGSTARSTRPPPPARPPTWWHT